LRKANDKPGDPITFRNIELHGGEALAQALKNHRQSWTADQVNQLRQLAKENSPTRVIGLK